MVITTLIAKHCQKTLCAKRKKKANRSILIIIDFQIKISDFIVLISAFHLKAKGPTKKHHILSYFPPGFEQSYSTHQPCALLPSTEVHFGLGAQSYVLHISCNSKLVSLRSPTASNTWSCIKRKPAIFSSLRASMHQQFK